MTLRIRGERNQLTGKMHPALLRVERCISSPRRSTRCRCRGSVGHHAVPGRDLGEPVPIFFLLHLKIRGHMELRLLSAYPAGRRKRRRAGAPPSALNGVGPKTGVPRAMLAQ
jgi:hypothetical protein